jgi:hypothetical protein
VPQVYDKDIDYYRDRDGKNIHRGRNIFSDQKLFPKIHQYYKEGSSSEQMIPFVKEKFSQYKNSSSEADKKTSNNAVILENAFKEAWQNDQYLKTVDYLKQKVRKDFLYTNEYIQQQLKKTS